MELDNLLSLIQAVSESELTGFKYEEKGVKIQLTKEKEQILTAVHTADQPVPAVPLSTPEPVQSVENKETPSKPCGKIVTSPLVGTFYAAPAEDAEPFAKVGDQVKKGQVLAIVEAMKLMNEIESDYDGTIAEILAENGQGVEYGQPLFRLS